MEQDVSLHLHDGNFAEDLSSFDFLNGDTSSLVNTSSVEAGHKKRKSLGDHVSGDGGSIKRQDTQGVAKVSKKPGRKPQTDVPATKRKAQNRAAQRAFRERKENHLKNLESQIAELTKLHENDVRVNEALVAQVKSLKDELNEYKRRSLPLQSPTSAASRPHSYSENGGFLPFPDLNLDQYFGEQVPDSHLNFADPTGDFQDLAYPPVVTVPETGSHKQSLGSTGEFLELFVDEAFHDDSYHDVSNDKSPHQDGTLKSRGNSSSDDSRRESLSECPTGISNPGENGPATPYVKHTPTAAPVDATIDDFHVPSLDSFDPALFANYRDPKQDLNFDLALSNYNWDDPAINALPLYQSDIFNGALPSMPSAPSADLISQVDKARDGLIDEQKPRHPELKSRLDNRENFVSCEQILQKINSIKSDDLDINDLCKDLRTKAKCSENGMVVDKDHVKQVFDDYSSKNKFAFGNEGYENVFPL
ncbi:hypothetical protein K470DRAFT_257829 [Piedraia hortae CBS 480.64]|uniref:BZIP domain-containing protein n=1 Tax=Piedraia hortae CBS 480.64 TaxID=1314780 RepID=A0A6A7C052_9PEZI|nr:hypothetical protein K470DRAFT_257829 [Piedraia hortae CBS 480.64]